MSDGNVITDGFFILLILTIACGALWWILPESVEVEIAAILDRAIPLGKVRVPQDNASHAKARHGTDAEAVRACIDKGGMFSIWLQPNGKFLRLCQLPDAHYGVQVCKDVGSCFNEVTAFIKERISDPESLLKYLEDLGAEQVWPVP